MVYNILKRAVLAVLLSLGMVTPCLAQTYAEGMRQVTVNTLMEYGQELYDRGDLDGAKAVFTHVLSFDSHQPQALKYLKEMGYVPQPPVAVAAPKPLPQLLPQVVVPRPQLAPVSPADKAVMDAVNVADIESLKKAIDAQKHIIERLKEQIKQMRAGLPQAGA